MNIKTKSERFIEKRKADAEARKEVHKVYDEKEAEQANT